mmetsp:Transcript_86268/g.252348  ORF Transcript_86268/g.252348 Transcript_86268/m.252348 type:complete len:132 (+) Transcript_86268:66-461(+)
MFRSDRCHNEAIIVQRYVYFWATEDLYLVSVAFIPVLHNKALFPSSAVAVPFATGMLISVLNVIRMVAMMTMVLLMAGPCNMDLDLHLVSDLKAQRLCYASLEAFRQGLPPLLHASADEHDPIFTGQALLP